jgi:hypothetical protein
MTVFTRVTCSHSRVCNEQWNGKTSLSFLVGLGSAVHLPHDLHMNRRAAQQNIHETHCLTIAPKEWVGSVRWQLPIPKDKTTEKDVHKTDSVPFAIGRLLHCISLVTGCSCLEDCESFARAKTMERSSTSRFSTSKVSTLHRECTTL